MTAETKNTLVSLKQQFHSLMNGPLSSSMREKGLNYRVIYGVEWSRLQELAGDLDKDADLAIALWKEDIRECRLLAGLVMPAEHFSQDLAEVWAEDMHYPEEAQYTTLSLFQNLPFASEMAFNWIADKREMFQLCGYLILTRLFMKGYKLDERSTNEFLDQAASAATSSNAHLRKSAVNAILKFSLLGQMEEKLAGRILHQLQV